jgi:PAS domain S-box-containing protein
MTRPCRVLYVTGESERPAGRLGGAEGLVPVGAPTVGDALDRIRDGDADCVVAEHRPPAIDGLDILRRVRAADPDVPVVLSVPVGDSEAADAALSAGATDYVQYSDGPADVHRLAARIRTAVDRQRATGTAPERIASLARRVGAELVRATCREDVDAAVCETLADAEPYVFAWIGGYDPGDGRVRPRAAAGIEDGYLADVEVTAGDGPSGQGPTGRAVRTRSVQVVQDVAADERYEPWRDAALERGYRSSAAVPLVHEETLYGVLNVYSGRRAAFDAVERALLAELGETVARALHRVQVGGEYESQYRTLFEEAPVMFALTRDREGGPVVEDCNRRFAQRLGYDKPELRGRPLADLYSEESARRLLEGDGYERALSGEFLREDREFVTIDGERVSTLLRATPRRTGDGEVVGTYALYVDVTERERAREVLRQVEAMDSAMDGVAILDSDGTYVYVNPAHAEIYGYDDPDALLGETWRICYGDDERERFETDVLPELRAEGEWRGEATGLRADGTTFPQEVSLTRLEDGELICVVRDITGRKATERRLESQLDDLEVLSQVVRHDIRNNLQVILAYTELLEDHVDEAGREYLETVQENGQQAVDLTRTARRLADTVLGPDEERRPLRVDRVLEPEIADRRTAHPDAEITVAGAVPEVHVLTNDLLESVFRNLLENAVQHNDTDAPEVVVTVTERDDDVLISVADDGPGVPDDRKRAIFGKGQVGLDSDGTGLGLYLVCLLVDSYGGDVWVTDNDPCGAVFNVTLPKP